MNIHGYKLHKKGMIRFKDYLLALLFQNLRLKRVIKIKGKIYQLETAIKGCNRIIKRLQQENKKGKQNKPYNR